MEKLVKDETEVFSKLKPKCRIYKKEKTMYYENHIRPSLLIVSILSMIFFIRPTQTYASGVLMIGDRDRHHGRYAEVILGADRYYYDEGIFYTGTPDHYVVVEAPVGVIVYRVPSGYERVVIDGDVYYTYRDVYYRHVRRGYEVVRVEKSHAHGYGHHHGHEQGEHYGHD